MSSPFIRKIKSDYSNLPLSDGSKHIKERLVCYMQSSLNAKLSCQSRYKQHALFCQWLDSTVIAEQLNTFSEELALDCHELRNAIKHYDSQSQKATNERNDSSAKLCAVPPGINAILKECLSAERLAIKSTETLLGSLEKQTPLYGLIVSIYDREKARASKLANYLEY